MIKDPYTKGKIKKRKSAINTENKPQTHSAKLAQELWQTAINQCHGTHATQRAIEELDPNAEYAILSIGKAAASMTVGALSVLGTKHPCLTITKEGHIDEDLMSLCASHTHINCHEASHPVPDARSLEAGRMARDFIENITENTVLIMLISGGASALCELLPPGTGLRDLQTLTSKLLKDGATIEEINKARSDMSLIKQGKLLKAFKGQEVRAYLISDVAGDDIKTIASGIALYPSNLPKEAFKHSITLLSSNEAGRNAAAKLATSMELEVQRNSENLYGDVYDCAYVISRILKRGDDGIYIFGGEPTVTLPDNPGEGGRAQCLALALAKELKDTTDITCLVAGTDGTDGPTGSAGGMIDGQTFTPTQEAEYALKHANSGAFLRKKNALYITGATGTNVMDITICVKLCEEEAARAVQKMAN